MREIFPLNMVDKQRMMHGTTYGVLLRIQKRKATTEKDEASKKASYFEGND